MSEKSALDLVEAHRYFSAECFNRAWDLIELPARTPEQDRTMLQLGLTSLWHWSQRPDRTTTTLSVGYWQVARIYALLGQADEARRYAQLCLESAQAGDVPPFYLAYAYEALARAEAVARDWVMMKDYLRQARAAGDLVTDADARRQLLDDLAGIK